MEFGFWCVFRPGDIKVKKTSPDVHVVLVQRTCEWELVWKHKCKSAAQFIFNIQVSLWTGADQNASECNWIHLQPLGAITLSKSQKWCSSVLLNKMYKYHRLVFATVFISCNNPSAIICWHKILSIIPTALYSTEPKHSCSNPSGSRNVISNHRLWLYIKLISSFLSYVNVSNPQHMWLWLARHKPGFQATSGNTNS